MFDSNKGTDNKTLMLLQYCEIVRSCLYTYLLLFFRKREKQTNFEVFILSYYFSNFINVTMTTY